MEVVAAVASFIAIGQAIAALPKIAGALKTFSKAEKELADLVKEIERTTAYYEYVKGSTDLFSNSSAPEPQPVSEPPYLYNLRTDLEAFIKQLRDLVESCSRTKDAEKQSKASKLLWFRKKGEVIEMRDRCRELTHQLESAITPFLLQIQRNHTNLLVELHTYVVKPLRSPPRALESSEHSSVLGEDAVDVRIEESPTLGNGFEPSLKTVQRLVPGLGTYRNGFPRQQCDCNCHSFKGLPTQRSSYQILAGGISFAYSRTMTPKDRKCCECNSFGSRRQYKVDFRCPLWLWSGVVRGSVSLDTSNGISAWLRPTAVVRSSDWIWHYSGNGYFDRFIQRMDALGLSLSDASEHGGHLLEAIVLAVHRTEFLGILQDRLKQLKATTAILRAAWGARLLLYDPRLAMSDNTIHLLRRLVEMADEDNEDELTTALKSISDPERLVQALQWYPGLARITSPTGQTLLHVACYFGYIDAAEILLNQGLDVNAQDSRGCTPLLAAIQFSSIDCAHLLLDRGCDPNLTDLMSAPIWTALKLGSKDGDGLIQRLQRMGAHFGSRALEFSSIWEFINGMQRSEIGIPKRLYQTVLEFGGRSTMEVKDSLGYTPLLRAVTARRSVTAKVLIEAGAKFNTVNNSGQNILHRAAESPNTEVIRVLDEAKMHGIDIRTKDSWEHTPLSDFWWGRIMVLHEPHPDPDWSRPGEEETARFEALLRGVRDRTIEAELERLQSVVTMIKARLISEATEELHGVMQAKLDAKIGWEAETFRAIELQVKQDLLEPAIESLEEFMEVSRARMQVSPFDEPDVDPEFFHLHSGDQREGSAGGSDDEEETEWYTTSGSEYEEWSEED